MRILVIIQRSFRIRGKTFSCKPLEIFDDIARLVEYLMTGEDQVVLVSNTDASIVSVACLIQVQMRARKPSQLIIDIKYVY